MLDKNMIRWEQGSDGVVVLTLDDPGQLVNTMNQTYVDSMEATVARLEAERETLAGVVLTSAKKSFFAGGDIGLMSRARPKDAAELSELCTVLKSQLRRLETLGRPVAAALNGTALGGGLEIALACHHRIALDLPGSRFGLPEVTLGLLPGAGGVSRTVRLLGLQDALADVLLKGQQYRPQEALTKGLVHELAPTREELLARARQWVLAHPDAAQPWDTKGFRIPGGTPSQPEVAASLPVLSAQLRKHLRGANMPAPRNILAAAVESAQVGLEAGQKIETSYLVELMTGQVSTNMMQAFFYDMQHINSGGSRPDGYPRHTARRVGVLGAGMMGAGIAYSCARSGLLVVLKDVSHDAARKGKAYSERLVGKAVARGRLTREAADEIIARIVPTEDPADLDGCDLVIEAVFEDPGVKRRVFGEIEGVVAPDAVLASNTSTLPITGLAKGVTRPEDFIGLHFFSPVDKMPLLEIITGEKTGPHTVAKAVDFARQIGKTPIVVGDSRGFFTSRVISKFIDEAVAMVGEGLHPASVEQAGSQAGYPTPPLRLLDELTLTLPRKIRDETRAAVLAEGGQWRPHGSEQVMDRMIDEFGRGGRSSGAGFYEYTEGTRKSLWPGLYEHFTVPGREIPFEDMKERMLFAEALDTVRCLDEGVLRSVPDANVGSLLGIGFPAWTGGVLQYINGYPGGLPGFVTRARVLAARYGERFEPPASLVAKAERGERYA
ncbi:3-hydroxyacyl-CoA dehydrogenase NAD-binding domain-containing protein [Streptomyces griseoloalbus]|uniref:3-hydroxyacyl-CoA dehydrogenase/enoyl-CoA hydratase/3-hydroxybutyryl-CoA epimerase n=1 Tax=Streptomyces griseoloalbus TaxID=67303 RepID=A0A7W8F7C6_9ACTN|nr:3-hydroxyacyl-CoA dehydrogenase NAD-binding domain-containing protein [Streptomyces albaduncus]MBB5124832.1 3-hydroxyacyl-CoA dehydrogenase/enoyl-CoA hydratase/3-hydroxybutyryl-CoA epimerase [Streptomyces albaduncus]GGW39711.1 3-hydroxyacyl-CoA dehydrogenase [Streptomyces albaduncus]